jgi:hypothetical protein
MYIINASFVMKKAVIMILGIRQEKVLATQCLGKHNIYTAVTIVSSLVPENRHLKINTSTSCKPYFLEVVV